MKIGFALILGAWLAGSLAIGGVATKNFFIIDDLLNSQFTHAQFRKDAAQLGKDESRAMLRYFSSELNRFYFKVWGDADLGLVTAMLTLAWMGIKQKKFQYTCLALFLLTLITSYYLTPQIVDVGRTLDFVPRIPPPSGLVKFGYLHAAYSTSDLLKVLAGFWMAIALIKSGNNPTEAENP